VVHRRDEALLGSNASSTVFPTTAVRCLTCIGTDVPLGDFIESVTVRSSNPAAPLLTVIYGPPSTNANRFLTEFSDLLSNLILDKRPVLITGYFNLHVDNCSDKSATSF